MAAEVKNITVRDADAPDEWHFAVTAVEELLNHVTRLFRQPGYLSFRSGHAGVLITPHFPFKDLPSVLLWTHEQQGTVGAAAAPAGAEWEYFKACTAHAPSRLGAGEWQQLQGLKRPRLGLAPHLMCGRPLHALGLAAALMHPVIGRFVDAINNLRSQARQSDAVFVMELCKVSLGIFDKEHMRATALRPLLQSYLGPEIEREKAVGKPHGASIFCDGLVSSGGDPPFQWCSVIIEFENELGATSSDKYFQGQGYYANVCSGSIGMPAMRRSCFPCLLVEIQGPYIRVSAMSFFDQVHTTPLTPHLFLSPLQDEGHRRQLVSVLHALRVAVKELHAYYRQLCSEEVELQLPGRLPVLKFPAPWPLWMVPDGGINRLSDISEFKKPLMFTATMDNQPVVVKFAQRYGADVHRSWAAAGLAPKLLSFDALPGGWHMAVMERLPRDQWTCLCCLDSALKPAARKAALAALALAHQLPFKGAGAVHGDARDPNVMVNASLLTAQQQATAERAEGGSAAEPAASSSGGEVASAIKFVDFEMAGEEGVAVYPMFMSPAVAWPSGANDNQVMLQRHDTELLSQENSVMVPPPTWQQLREAEAVAPAPAWGA